MKTFYAILAFVAFMCMLGTVGALECDLVDFTQFLVQGGLSALVFLFCTYKLN